MSVTIAPIRLLLASVCLLTAWLLAAIGLAGRTEEQNSEPFSGWRKWCVGQIVLSLYKWFFFLLGFHNIRIIGKRATHKSAPILCVAPHSSIIDVFVLLTGNTLLTGLSKIEMTSPPIIGTLVRFTQPVLVKRDNPDSRMRTINEIERRCKSKGDWPQIVIFPEGTCTNRSCLITYKPGAFYPGEPVQPVCLRYPNKMDTITWTWDGPSAFTCLWLTLCQFHNYMEIEFLPVYNPTFDEKNDAKLYANNVRKVMQESLDCPVTDHTYDDCRLMQKAVTLKLPMHTGLVEFQKMHEKLGLSFDQMRDYLENFRQIVGKENTKIKIKEFANYLDLPVSSGLQELFEMYDRNNTPSTHILSWTDTLASSELVTKTGVLEHLFSDNGSGSIDFREYIIGLSLISNPDNSEETLSLAFQRDNDYISEFDFTAILYNAFKMDFADCHEFFVKVDADQDGRISYNDFKKYAAQKPEYATLFKMKEPDTISEEREIDVKTKSD